MLVHVSMLAELDRDGVGTGWRLEEGFPNWSPAAYDSMLFMPPWCPGVDSMPLSEPERDGATATEPRDEEWLVYCRPA